MYIQSQIADVVAYGIHKGTFRSVNTKYIIEYYELTQLAGHEAGIA